MSDISSKIRAFLYFSGHYHQFFRFFEKKAALSKGTEDLSKLLLTVPTFCRFQLQPTAIFDQFGMNLQLIILINCVR